MTDSLFEAVAHATRELTKYGFSTQEFAMLVQQHNMTDAEALAVAKVFDYLLEKRERSTVDFLLRTSHLPLKVPKTFDNFDFSRVTGKNVDKLRSLPTLSALYAHKNLAFIGRPGTGKTHLAQAFGRTCCEHGFRSYFIKMTELRDRMTSARRSGRESNLLSYLVRPSCLIIDEVGHCEFDKENTRRRATPTWSLPATVTLLSGRRTSARTMLFCAPWTASLTMLWSLPLRERASGAGSWRRLPCVLLLAHRLTHSRPGKQYCLGAGYP